MDLDRIGATGGESAAGVAFDGAALTWDEEPRRVRLARAVSIALAREVPMTPRMAALEYGCGTGLVTQALAPRLGRITAVDSSAGMLAVLERKVVERGMKNVRPLLLDLSAESPPPGRYDLIFSSMTLHHIRDVRSLLGLFYGLLRPGGYLAVADLDKEDGTFHGGREVEHHGFERGEFLKILSASGFTDGRALTAHLLRREAPGGGVREYPVFIAVGRRGG